MSAKRTGYATTSERGLLWDSVPMRLWQKAKRLGTWDPAAIDFERDREHWAGLRPVEREFILRTLALFQAGEEAVTLDLLPLIETVADEGRIEEEMYLTSFLWEEAKHVEFFRRWLDQVAEAHGDLWAYATPSYRTLFVEELPQAMDALRTDRSPATQIRASTTYNMIIEGVPAETGYHGFRESLVASGQLPGLLEGITLIARDESRHIRYGVYLLNRLIDERAAGAGDGRGLGVLGELRPRRRAVRADDAEVPGLREQPVRQADEGAGARPGQGPDGDRAFDPGRHRPGERGGRGRRMNRGAAWT